MRLGLLLCDHVRPGFRPLAGDYPEMFRRFFAAEAEIEEVVPFDLTASEFPEDLNEFEGWISSGSRHSVYDDVGWIHQFADLIRRFDQERRRYVGICFGAQMVGHALGGVVQQAEEGWQIGLKEVEVTETTTWMIPTANSFRILYSNADQIVQTPARMRTLGHSPKVAVSVIAVEDHMIGFQGHPEFTREYASVLMEARRGTSIPGEVVDAGLASLSGEPDAELLANWISRFFRNGSDRLSQDQRS